MNFHEKMHEKAKKAQARIVLPESLDVRIQKASLKALKNGLVKEIVFIGNPEEIARVAKGEGTDLKDVEIVDPLKADFFDDLAHTYHGLRKHKGLSFDEAAEQIRDPVYFAALMVKTGGARAGGGSRSFNRSHYQGSAQGHRYKGRHQNRFKQYGDDRSG